ncbi:MAG: hypothetical protein ABSG07_15600 [Terriglobales bacterium]
MNLELDVQATDASRKTNPAHSSNDFIHHTSTAVWVSIGALGKITGVIREPACLRHNWVYNAAMPEESRPWRLVGSSGKGEFDGYTVMAQKFENVSSFEIGWKIAVSRNTTLDPPHEYWVVNRRFYQDRSDLFSHTIEADYPHITESIEPSERKAVLKAIDEWTLKGRPAKRQG